MFDVGFGLVLSVFVYVLGHAVMYSFFEVSSLLSDAKEGLGIYGYYKLGREILFDVLLIGVGYLFLPKESFVFVMYAYVLIAGLLKYYIYRIPLIHAIKRKRYENGSGE